MTEPGDVKATVERILEFDEAKIGFTHAPTWGAMPAARRGIFKAGSEAIVPHGAHPRVEKCIRALCELGERFPVETRAFSAYPESGLRSINDIEWGPGVTIRVKGVCWYVKDGVPIIPLLQPRKMALTENRLSLYCALGRQAFCGGDWHLAKIELVDLSSTGSDVTADLIYEDQLPKLSDAQVARYVSTYVEAKIAVDAIRASRPKKAPKSKDKDLFDIK
jgi:hypothetical protein